MNEKLKLSKREQNLIEIRERTTPVAERIVLKEVINALSVWQLAKEIDVSLGSLFDAFCDLDTVVGLILQHQRPYFQNLYAQLPKHRRRPSRGELAQSVKHTWILR